MSEPILYAAADKAFGERHAPSRVIAECLELDCSCCNTAVLVVPAAMRETVILSQKSGRPIAVLCMDCFKRATANLAGVALLYFHDPKLQAVLAKHHAEMN